MNFKKTTLVKESFAYTLVSALEKAVPFLVLPIYSNHLNSEDVGLYILFQTLIEVVTPIVSLGIDNTVMVGKFRFKDDEFKRAMLSGLVFMAFGAVFWCVCVATVLGTSAFSGIGFESYHVLLCIAIVLARIPLTIAQALIRVDFRLLLYAKFAVGLSLMTNTTGLILVFTAGFGWLGIVYGQLVSTVTFGVLALIYLNRQRLFSESCSIASLKSLLKISVPLAVHRIGLWLGGAASKFVVSSRLGVNAAGLYGIAAIFPAILTILDDALSKALTPHIYKILSENEAYNEMKKISIVYYLVLFGLALVVYLLGYHLVSIIYGVKYDDSVPLVLPLTLAAFFKACYRIHATLIIYTKKTLNITKITLVSGLLNIVLSYVLITEFGMIGSAYALLIVNIVQYLITFRVSELLIPVFSKAS